PAARATGPSRLRPTDRGERIASAKLSGLAAAHQDGRLNEAAAVIEIHDVIAEHGITGDRIVIVMSDAASLSVDNPHRTRGLALLKGSGADVELARRMRDETGPRASVHRPTARVALSASPRRCAPRSISPTNSSRSPSGHPPGERWLVDETYVKVNGVW